MATVGLPRGTTRDRGILDALNGRYHKLGLWLFVAFLFAHWVEHLLQAVQIWVLDVPRPKALGALGELWPWLVQAEGLHYAYGLGTMVGLLLLAHAFTGSARRWWTAAIVLQAWHFLEHVFLLYQFATGYRFLGRAVQTSVLQGVFPRAELHLAYNLIVTVPITIAILLHWRVRERRTCSC